MLDYELLRVIWWLLLGVLLTGFAIMDGFDLGVAALLPWVAKSDSDRRIVINCVGPTWEGNQVWFILGGGAIFAAWPLVYAVTFSGFYLAMFLVLLALILRPVGFKYRSKLQSPVWRNVWDWCLFIGGAVPALIFGVALGNVLQGVPFHLDVDLRIFYTGSFWALLNPFALLCGLVSLTMLLMHGGRFLVTKTQGEIARKAARYSGVAAWLMIVLFVLAGLWWHLAMPHYVLNSDVSHFGPSNPLHKEVGYVLDKAISLQPFRAQSILWGLPIMAVLGALASTLFTKRERLAFLCSSISIIGVIGTFGFSLFPFILPSSSHPEQSLLVWDASSSHTTLSIMFYATVVFMPIILFYTAWVYSVLKGKVTLDMIEKDNHTAY